MDPGESHLFKDVHPNSLIMHFGLQQGLREGQRVWDGVSMITSSSSVSVTIIELSGSEAADTAVCFAGYMGYVVSSGKYST